MIRRLILLAALVAGTLVAAGPAGAVIPPDTRCRNGAVSITFDDGPHPKYTPRLLKILRANHAQATFFVEGQHAVKYPHLLRQMVADGHAVENHSWDHPEFWYRSKKQIASELSRTTAVITKATGIAPTLIRPPYGETDARIRSVFAKQHLAQELWTIDTNDWRGRSVKMIRKTALKGLRKHKTNVILMHDAVENSPRTLKAVPKIIKGIRKKGYCLVPLQITAPASRLSGQAITVSEGTAQATRVKVTFTLDSPSQRDATFRLRTTNVSAQAGIDYNSLTMTVPVKRGSTSVSTYVTIHVDPMPNPPKTFRVVLDQPKDIALATTIVPVTMTDNGAWDAERRALIAP